MRRVLVISLDVFGKFTDSILSCVEGEILLSELRKGLGGLEKNTRYFKGEKRKKIRKKGTRKLLKRCEIDRLTVVKSWKKRGNMYLGLITSYAWLWEVKMCTLINDRDYVRRRYEVSSNEYGRRMTAKDIMSNWPEI